MQFILQKKRLRVLSALLIAALVITMGMVLPTATGQPGGEAYAAAGDDLTVTVPADAHGFYSLYRRNTSSDSWNDYSYSSAYKSNITSVEVAFDLNDSDVGREFTVVYRPSSYYYDAGNNYVESKAARLKYGNTQTLGGYFGYPNETGAKFSKFVYGGSGGFINFAPVAGARVTLKVTPADNSGVVDPTSSQYLDTIRTYPVAHRFVKGSGGKTNLRGSSDYVDSQPGTGVYTFVLQPGTNYVFSATGSIKQGLIWVSYPQTWLGGHKGSSNNTPSKIKIVKSPAAGGSKAAGTIALKLGSATIKGKTAVDSYVSISNPFTGVQYSFYANPTANAASYSQKVEPGFYIVSNGITDKFIAVKSKKKATVNFTTSQNPKYDAWSAKLSIKVTGTVKTGKKLTASVKAYNLPYKFGKAPKFKYVWTDGTKILGKKASYKLKKADLKKGKKIFVIAYGVKHGYTHYDWATVR